MKCKKLGVPLLAFEKWPSQPSVPKAPLPFATQSSGSRGSKFGACCSLLLRRHYPPQRLVNLPLVSPPHPPKYGDRRDVHRVLRIGTWRTSRLSPDFPQFVSFAPPGLASVLPWTHGLRRGLHSDAASRLSCRGEFWLGPTACAVGCIADAASRLSCRGEFWLGPTACAVGCILTPLRGFVQG